MSEQSVGRHALSRRAVGEPSGGGLGMTAPTATLDVRLCAAGEAVLGVRGNLDAVAEARMRAFLRVLLDGGARRMIVDLSAASRIPAGVTAMLAALRDELRRNGGWLVVHGGLDAAEDLVTPLMEVFAAYREACPSAVGAR